MRVSYKWKSAGKCKHWGGSIIRLQSYKCFRSTSVDCKLRGIGERNLALLYIYIYI